MPTEDELDDEDQENEDTELPGRRLELIPHSFDQNLVFRFEFGPAILAQVREKLERNKPVLIEHVHRDSANYAGFYQLFWKESSVYVGRTTRPVFQRLQEHKKKLRGRIPLSEISTRYLFVEDLSLVGLSEDALIAYFVPLQLDAWGKMGFGSKATGHNRAGQESRWTEEFDFDRNYLVGAGSIKPLTLRKHIALIAKFSPVNLSIPQKQKVDFDKAHPDTTLILPKKQSFMEWIDWIKSRLSRSWRVREQPMAWYVELYDS